MKRDNLTPTGITMFNGDQVCTIDGVLTVINSIHGDMASGYTIKSDLTTEKCFVARGQGKFAHGKTAHDAVQALQAKLLEDVDIEEKVEKFAAEFKLGTKYPAQSFYLWHHVLTGSCEFGRKQFATDHNVDMNGEMTPEEFFTLVKGAYGWENVKQAAKAVGFKVDED